MIDRGGAQLLAIANWNLASYFDGKHGFEEAKFTELVGEPV